MERININDQKRYKKAFKETNILTTAIFSYQIDTYLKLMPRLCTEVRQSRSVSARPLKPLLGVGWGDVDSGAFVASSLGLSSLRNTKLRTALDTK